VLISFPSVVFQHFSKTEKQGRLTRSDDRHGPLPILYFIYPLTLHPSFFVYTDQLLRHCIFIYSNVHYWLVCLVQWLLIVLLLVGWVIWNNKPIQLSTDQSGRKTRGSWRTAGLVKLSSSLREIPGDKTLNLRNGDSHAIMFPFPARV